MALKKNGEKFSQPVFEYIHKYELGNAGWEEVFKRQRDNWLEFYWVAVPYEQANHAECFRAASKGIAQRKLLRNFTQVNEDKAKCSVTGSQSALPLNMENLQQTLKKEKVETMWRENEQLGTLMTIKRLAPLADKSLRRPNTILSVRNIAADNDDPALLNDNEPKADGKLITKYLAVLHMDGDQMGARLSNLEYLGDHRAFSKKLSDFAQGSETVEGVASIVKRNGGKTGTLIYAGGDDVLALLPVAKVLGCALALRDAFQEATGDASQKVTGCTMSAGITIMPENMPLDLALELSRAAEASAKEDYGRDAVVIMEAHGNGRIRPAGAKWDMIPLINALVELFDKQLLSGKLGYDLQSLAHDMGGSVPPEARQAEAKRLIRRRKSDDATTGKLDPIVSKLAGFDEYKAARKNSDENLYLDFVAEKLSEFAESDNMNWDDMANWVILARFLGQGSREEKQRAKP